MKWDTDNTFTNATFKMSAYYPNEGDYLIINQDLADVSINNLEYYNGSKNESNYTVMNDLI